MSARRPDPRRGHSDDVSRRLARERPLADPSFRAALRSSLGVDGVEEAPSRSRRAAAGSRRRRRRRARRLVAAYAGSGLALLAFAAAGVAGLGPLAA